MDNNKGKIEGLLADLGRKMDGLLSKAKQASEEHHLNDKLDELNTAKEKLERELNQYVQDDERWQEVKSNLRTAAGELKKAFETTFRKNQAGSPPPPADPTQNRESPDGRTLGTP